MRRCDDPLQRLCASHVQHWRVCLLLPEHARVEAVPSPLWDLVAIILKSYEHQEIAGSAHNKPSYGMRLHVPVIHPDFWATPEVVAEVRFILRSYWGRRFDLELVPAGEGECQMVCCGVSKQDVLQPDKNGTPRVVAFTPDLDSVAATIQELNRHAKQVILLTLESNRNNPTRRTPSQRLVEEICGYRAPRAIALLPEPGLKAFTSAEWRLLHVVLAAAVSLSTGSSMARFFENGIDNLQLPATANALTQPKARAVHPEIVAALNDVISRFTKTDFCIENPYLTWTLAEILEALFKNGGPDMVERIFEVPQEPERGQERRIDQHISALGAVLATNGHSDRYEALFLRELAAPMNENIAANYVHLLRGLPELPDHELARQLMDVGPGWDSGGPVDDAMITNLFRRHMDTVHQVLMRGVRHYAQEITTGNLPPMSLIARAAMPRDVAVESLQIRQATFRKRTDRWELWYESGDIIYLNNFKGLFYISILLQHPGRVYSAAELRFMEAGQADTPMHMGSMGELADRKAITEYRRRLRTLHAELDIANENNDLGQVQRARQEIDALQAELRRCLGRTGQPRIHSDIERARKSVSNAIRRALGRIRAMHSGLAGHLESSLQVGTYLCYQPRAQITWRV